MLSSFSTEAETTKQKSHSFLGLRGSLFFSDERNPVRMGDRAVE